MSAQYFAQIDANNIVTNVAVVTAEFMAQNAERYTGTWVETFFDTAGKQYAGVGYTYDADADVFLAPQPYLSWTLDSNHDWQPPTPKPDGNYQWFEPNQQWIEVIEP